LASRVAAAVISAIVMANAIRSSRREKPPFVSFFFNELIESSLGSECG
jgi:hypothetical protein